MANNRMYLVNKRTGAALLLAKFFPSGGWGLRCDEGELQRALTFADFNIHQLRANGSVIARTRNPFDGPFKAESSEWDGQEWVLEFDGKHGRSRADRFFDTSGRRFYERTYQEVYDTTPFNEEHRRYTRVSYGDPAGFLIHVGGPRTPYPWVLEDLREMLTKELEQENG